MARAEEEAPQYIAANGTGGGRNSRTEHAADRTRGEQNTRRTERTADRTDGGWNTRRTEHAANRTGGGPSIGLQIQEKIADFSLFSIVLSK